MLTLRNSPYPPLSVAYLLLDYSIICWWRVFFCFSEKEKDICHYPGLTNVSPPRAQRQEAASWETTGHHQSLSPEVGWLLPAQTTSLYPIPAPYSTSTFGQHVSSFFFNLFHTSCGFVTSLSLWKYIWPRLRSSSQPPLLSLAAETVALQ